MAIKKIIKKAKDKIIDVASDAMSFPARSKANKSIARDTAILDDIKLVQQAKGTEDGGDYRDPLFRARVNVSNYKYDQEKKMQKIEEEEKKKKIKTAKKVNNNPKDYESDYAKMRSSASR